VGRLHGADYAVIPDRIETATYAMAAAITDGEVELLNARATHLEAALAKLDEAGVKVVESNRGLTVTRKNGPLSGTNVETDPYPGFPTDLQAQFTALMTAARGESLITETIFENRFMHIPELHRMGARIAIDGTTAMVRGPCPLKGAPVMASDLRASASLVIAGLAAEGETVVNRVYHLDRGYERLEEKLAGCGADIERSRED
jgi:UDP-N-acetylglucosamine 1-carboxyvinyltransferase